MRREGREEGREGGEEGGRGGREGERREEPLNRQKEVREGREREGGRDNWLDMVRRDLRDLKGRGPWAVASECSEDATKGPRPFKSRRSLCTTSNLFRFACCKFIGQ